MIECTFRTKVGSCQHVDANVGLTIVISDNACEYCVKHYPPEDRKEKSAVVESWIRKEQASRGLPFEPARNHVPGQPKPIQGPYRKPLPQKPKNEIPIVSDPQARLEICTDCDEFSVTNQYCKVPCGCRTRPRPLATEGKECPLSKWRRS